MRLYCVTLLVGVTAASGASASSLVTVAAPTSPSSIVYYGTPAPEAAPAMSAAASPNLPALNYPAPLAATPMAAAPIAQASPSIVALGEPAVENFQVAAIAEKKPASHKPNFTPMVIRGGISGELFARESSPAVTPASSSPSQPVPEQASAAPTRQTKAEQRRTPEPTPEADEAPPPPSKLGRMPGVQ